jgi:hypothetical protein
MTEQLDALIAAVEAGELPNEDWRLMHDIWSPRNWHDIGHNVRYSMHGSLDAAKALHDALLPDATAMIGTRKPRAIVYDAGDKPYIAFAEPPARAWLLAILKAYRAQQVTP